MEHTWSSYNYDVGFRYGEAKKIDVLIGCPVQKRDWIMDKWFWHVNAACKVANMHPGFVFVMDPTEEPLHTMIVNQARLASTQLHVGEITEEDREDKRTWGKVRYDKMVDLRNILLEGVREQAPPLFLSLDSDILLHEEALKSMVDNLEDFDAIGGKAYMTHTGTTAPSFGQFSADGRMVRNGDAWGSFKVGCIMAVKLMRPSAYNVDYKFDAQGEDIGWSRNCREAGLRLKWDGSVVNKHVMRKQDLDHVDKRVGF